MRCRTNEGEQIQVNVEFPGLTVVSSNNGGRTWTERPVGASRRNTTLMLATRFVSNFVSTIFYICGTFVF